MISIFLRTSLILSFLFWHLPLCCIYHVLTYRYVLVKYIGISCFRFGLWDFFLRKSFLQNCCKCSPFFFSLIFPSFISVIFFLVWRLRWDSFFFSHKELGISWISHLFLTDFKWDFNYILNWVCFWTFFGFNWCVFFCQNYVNYCNYDRCHF